MAHLFKPQKFMNNALRNAFRNAVRLSLQSLVVLTALAALLALAALVVALLWPSSHHTYLNVGPHSLHLNQAAGAGVLQFGLAWLIVTCAVMVALLATLFALALASGALALAAAITALPLVAIGFAIWWVLRRPHTARAATP